MKHETLYGVPIVVDEYLRPGEGVVDNVERRVYLHPTVAYAMEAAADARNMDAIRDPSVMIAASVRWQAEVIERAAKRAVQRLELVMLQQDSRRMKRRHEENVRAELHDMMLSCHPGVEHSWARDILRRTARCRACGVPITEELAHRLGIELGNRRASHLSILVDDQWHEVGGIRNLSLTREDGAR